MASPHRTPTALRILKGNPGKRPLPVDEAQSNAVALDMPAPEQIENNIEAVKAWQSWLPLLVNMRVMTEADVPMLVVACEAFAEERNAIAQINVTGAVQVAASGHAQVSAWTTVREKALIRYTKILCLFGMTPSDRTKVKTVAAKKAGNPFDM